MSLNKVWETSGHTQNFSDPLLECKECNARFRSDVLDNTQGICPTEKCSNSQFGDPREFNMMFKTNIGPVVSDTSEIYLRPETAQGMFVNFSQVQSTMRKRLPFGIAQIGKAFRNEITTGNFIFRTREFEMMEIEYFVMPGEDDNWHKTWVSECINWYKDIGLNENLLRIREHDKDELSHYSKATSDIEYRFPWGCLLYTSPSPRDGLLSRMPSSA